MRGDVGKSCVNKMYRRGPKTLPCGTPDLLGWEVNSEFSIFTKYVLFETPVLFYEIVLAGSMG